jgi:tetratricopeptide (TPR) repeat protein
LWPGDTFVDFDIGLNSAIRQVRAALGDSAKNPVFVETVPRHGYRFVGCPRGAGPAGRVDVWRQAFDTPSARGFEESHVTGRHGGQIALKLTPDQQRWFSGERSTDCDFRQAYLRGRYYWKHETSDGLVRSHYYLSAAVEKNPDSGEAHAAMADWYVSAGTHGLLRQHQAIAHAKVEALRAFELEPALAEVHACLGRIALRECNLLRAHAECETAARLNPELVDPVLSSAVALSCLARHDEARAYVSRAKDLDPVSPRTYLVAAIQAYNAGCYALAIEESQEALALERHLAPAFYYVGASQLQMGLTQLALDSLVVAARESNRHPAPLSAMAQAHAQEGRTSNALAIIAELVERATRAEVSPYYFTLVYMALGEVEKALEYLRCSFDLRAPEMIGIAVSPLLRPLHGHPEFEEMLKSMGISSRPR